MRTNQSLDKTIRLPRLLNWQKEVVKSKARYKILRCGRRCFAADTKVLTSNGYVPIQDVKSGDYVVSYSGIAEYKKVVGSFEFVADTDPKPMLEYYIDGKHFRSTYDHELYNGERWVEAIEFAWGAMDASQRQKFKLLCEQYGQNFDDISSRWEKDGSDETSTRRFWVLQDCNGWQDKGYFNGQNLEISSVTVHPAEVTYDLEVEDNHNYVVNDLLVHNTGKTFGIIIDSLNLALYNDNCSIAYVGLTYGHAKDVVWEDYLSLAGDTIAYKNSQELLIKLHNGSRIKLYSWDSIDNMLGKKYHKVYLDEAAVAKNLQSAWDNVIEPTLLDYRGEAWFTSMPRGKGQFKKLIDDSKTKDDWQDFHFTSYDNESIPDVKADLDRKRADIAPSVFAQQYLAEFVDIEGRIYTEFNRDMAVAECPFMPVRYGFSVDFGYNHPLAAYIYAIGSDDQIHVLKELYSRKLDDQQRLKAILSLTDGFEIDIAVGDSEDPIAIMQLNRSLPFTITPAIKPQGSVLEGINVVKSDFHSGQLTISDKCVNLIDELETYSWKLDQTGAETDKPIKENDDGVDSLRYFVTKMRTGAVISLDDIYM